VHREVVADERGCDVGVNVGRPVRRIGCVGSLWRVRLGVPAELIGDLWIGVSGDVLITS